MNRLNRLREAQAERLGCGDQNAQAQRIEGWQAAQTELVHLAGVREALWSNAVQGFGPYTHANPGWAARQSGKIRRVVMNIAQVDGGLAWKYKHLRHVSGTTFQMTGERSFTPTVGRYVLDLDPPMAIEARDVVGVYTPSANNRIFRGNSRVIQWRYANGDVTGSGNFTGGDVDNNALDALGRPPYLAIVGDSINEGNLNGAGHYWTCMDNTAGSTRPQGDPACEIGAQIKARIGNGKVLEYQNFSLTAQTFAWAVSTGVPEALLVKAHTLLVAFGINDIATGRTWAQAEANLESIKTLFEASSSERLMFAEISPYGGAPGQPAVRTWNTNLAAWCATNGYGLVKLHDEMADSGNPDILKAEYDAGDHVHISEAGVSKYAECVSRYL